MRTAALALLAAVIENPGVSCPASASNCPHHGDYLHWVGRAQTERDARVVAVSGSFAYTATDRWGGHSLEVVDIADPEHPVVIGRAGSQPTEDLAVSGTYLYAARTDGSLAVYDVADPQNLTLVNAPGLPGAAHRIEVVDEDHGLSLAFVAADAAGLLVLDISDPHDVEILGSMAFADVALGVAAPGTHAYVAASQAGLLVVETTDPENLRLVGGLKLAEWYPHDVAVEGHYAYVTESYRLTVVDIEDPTNPRFLGSVPVSVRGPIDVRDSYVYLPSGGDGLTVVSVWDPYHPIVVGWLDKDGGDALGLALSPTHVCVANTGRGIEVIDIADPRDPPGVREYNWEASGIASAGTLVCAVGPGLSYGRGGFRTIDVSDPWQPRLVFHRYQPGEPRDVAMSSTTRAYVAEQEAGGLESWDVAVPGDPRLVGYVDLPSQPQEIALSGSHAYVACYTSGLQVIDVTDPENLRIVGWVDPGTVRGVAVSGGHAYLACSTSLEVADITRPEDPWIVGGVITPGHPRSVAIAGSFAFVADDAAGLTVVDVSNPEMPLVVANLAIGTARGIAVEGEVAYVSTDWLVVIDVSNPTAPWTRETIHVDRPMDIVLRDADVYLAGGLHGFQLLHCPDQAPAASDEETSAPAGQQLRVAPNPASSPVTLRLDPLGTGRVRVAIHDVSGRSVRRLYDGWVGVSSPDLVWDRRDDDGREVAPGVYLVRARTDRGTRESRIVIVE